MLQNGLEEELLPFMNERQCELCKEYWPDDWEFYRHGSTPWCIACEVEQKRFGDVPPKKRNRPADYYVKQREGAAKKWREMTPEQRARKNDRARERARERRAVQNAK
jgi:hypothetical protein